MKELDVLLEGFLDKQSDTLMQGGWPQFEALLDHEDDVLWDWLQGSQPPDPVSLEPLVEAIRERP